VKKRDADRSPTSCRWQFRRSTDAPVDRYSYIINGTRSAMQVR